MKKERNSSLELLRIICMLLIIVHHYVVHGDIIFSIDDNAFAVGYLKSISMFGRSACSMFALITGYFMIEANTRNKFYRRIIPTLFRIEFCSLIIFFIVCILGGDWDFKDIIKIIPPISFGNNWYIATYICFFFFIPFINEFLLSINKIRFQQLLIVIFLLYFVTNTVSLNRLHIGDFYFMLNLYTFGAYYKLYGNNQRKNIKNLYRSCKMVRE